MENWSLLPLKRHNLRLMFFTHFLDLFNKANLGRKCHLRHELVVQLLLIGLTQTWTSHLLVKLGVWLGREHALAVGIFLRPDNLELAHHLIWRIKFWITKVRNGIALILTTFWFLGLRTRLILFHTLRAVLLQTWSLKSTVFLARLLALLCALARFSSLHYPCTLQIFESGLYVNLSPIYRKWSLAILRREDLISFLVLHLFLLSLGKEKLSLFFFHFLL